MRISFAGLAAGLLVGAMAWLWPADGPVILSGAERVQAALAAGVMAALIAALTARRTHGTGGLITAALLPIGLAAALSLLPVQGQTHSRVSPVALGGTLAAVVAAGIAARTRAWPASAILSLGVLGLALGRLSGSAGHGLTGPPRQLVLLSIDTLRADLLASSAASTSSSMETPALSRLAREAQVFTRAYATAPLTGPSHTSMLSGLDAGLHGVLTNGQRLPEDLPWVPALFQAAGWHTRAFVSAGVLEAHLGFARGFQEFDSTFEDRLARGHAVFHALGFRRGDGDRYRRGGDETLDLLLAQPVIGPTFTWVHLYDLHWPYEPSAEARAALGISPTATLPESVRGEEFGPEVMAAPDPELADRGRQLYAAQYLDLDRRVGRLLEALGPEATVVVVGDHGESLGEHGYWFRHGRLPHAPDTWVPLLIRGPDVVPGSSAAAVSVADVAPTLLGLAGLPVPAGMDGVDLLAPLPDRAVVSRSVPAGMPFPRPDKEHGLGRLGGIAVRQGEQSLVRTRWEGEVAYDRGEDPLELTPGDPAVGDPLRPALDAALARRSNQRIRMAEGEEEEEMLRALGYVE